MPASEPESWRLTSEAICRIAGNAARILRSKFESGGHRVQRRASKPRDARSHSPRVRTVAIMARGWMRFEDVDLNPADLVN